jgi:hypothetical protein
MARRFKGGIDVVDVSLVMLCVVDFHGLRIDMRFQRIICIGQGG